MSNTIKLGNLNISSFKVGGSDCSIYLGTVKVYPQDSPTPPVGDFKARITYSNSDVYVVSADTSTTLTQAEVTGGPQVADNIVSAEVGSAVTSIGYAAFASCGSLTSVTLPDGLTTIGFAAFSNCSGLTAVNIPSGVTLINTNSFFGCSGLTAVTIPALVTQINASAFEGCGNLQSITCLATTPPILGDNRVFMYTNDCPIYVPCNSVEAYKAATIWRTYYSSRIQAIPNSCVYDGKLRLTYYGGSTYEVPADGNTTLTQAEVTGGTMGKLYIVSAEIGSAVTSVDTSAFSGCTNLSSVSISDSVTSIGFAAFYSCSGLTSVDIPNGVTSIGASAFGNCTGLTSVVIPDSVTSIGNSAFYWCTSLTSVTIPSGVTSIGSSTFTFCTSLTSVTIPSGVTNIGNNAFQDCSGLTSVVIPDSVTNIGITVFNRCTSLTSVTIPSGVTSIGGTAFYGCTGLTSITCNAVTPPTLGGDNVFDNTNNCPIYVPFISVSTYQAANYWREYSSRLVEIPT